MIIALEPGMENNQTYVLIASANSIFRKGIEKILSNRTDFNHLVIQQAGDIEEVLEKYSKYKPSILIIDFDDKNINRKIFLNSFMDEQHNAKLLLVSLQQTGNVIFYDRQVLSTDQAHQWLQVPWNENKSFLSFNNAELEDRK
jgi:cytochrome c oxidase subunit 2